MTQTATRRGMVYRKTGWVPLIGNPLKGGQPPAGTYAKPLSPHPGEFCPNCGASVAWYARSGDHMCGHCHQLWSQMTPRRGVPVEDLAHV